MRTCDMANSPQKIYNAAEDSLPDSVTFLREMPGYIGNVLHFNKENPNNPVQIIAWFEDKPDIRINWQNIDHPTHVYLDTPIGPVDVEIVYKFAGIPNVHNH
mgnify:CR=1 FL=1